MLSSKVTMDWIFHSKCA